MRLQGGRLEGSRPLQDGCESVGVGRDRIRDESLQLGFKERLQLCT